MSELFALPSELLTFIRATRHFRFNQRYEGTFIAGVKQQSPDFVLAEGDEQSPYRLARVV